MFFQRNLQEVRDELFAPVVDETSVHIFLTTCAMLKKHLVHLDDAVSACLYAAFAGPTQLQQNAHHRCQS